MDADLDSALLCEGSAMESRGDTLIWELMKTVKDLSSRGESDEIRGSLLELEKGISIEFENLRKQCELLVRSRNLIELEKLKCEEKLEIVQGESQNLRENAILRFIEMEKELEDSKTEKLLADQVGETLRCQNLEYSEYLERLRAEKSIVEKELVRRTLEAWVIIEGLMGLQFGVSQMEEELKKQLLDARVQKRESDKKIDEMSFKVLEIDCLNVKLEKLEVEMKKLKKENLLADEKLRQHLLAAEIEKKRFNETILAMETEKLSYCDELKQSSLETSRTIEELREEVFESSQMAEDLKRKLSEAADIEKTKFAETIQEMSRSKLEVDCLNKKLQEMGNEIWKLRAEKVTVDEELVQRTLEACGIIEGLMREKSKASQMEEELKKQLLEADIQKRESDKKIDEMSSTVIEIDCLNVKLEKVEFEMKKLKKENLLAEEKVRQCLLAAEMEKKRSNDTILKMEIEKRRHGDELKQSSLEASRTVEELRLEMFQSSLMAEDLKRQLSEAADIEKRMSAETIQQMSRNKLEVDCLNKKLQKMGKEIERLTVEGFSNAQTIEQMRCQASQLVEELNKQFIQAAIEKRKFDETIEEMVLKIVEVDCLNAILQETESDIKRFKADKLLDSQKLKELMKQSLEASKMVEALKRKLLEAADLEKRKCDETNKEMELTKLKVGSLNTKLQETEDEIKKLKAEKVLDVRTIEDLRLQISKASHIEEFLTRQLTDAAELEKRKCDETIEEMKLKNLEIDSLNAKLQDLDQLMKKSDETTKEMKRKQFIFGCLSQKLQYSEGEMRRLRREKLLDTQHIEELKCKGLEASKKLELLKMDLSEAKEENSKNNETIKAMMSEKLQVDSLNVKMIEMENEMREFKHRKKLDSKIMEDWRRQNLGALQKNREASKMVEDLKCKLSSSEYTVKEVRRINLEDYQTIQDLRGQKLEALRNVDELRCKNEKVVEDMQRKLRSSEYVIMKLKQMNLEDYEIIQQLRQNILVTDQAVEAYHQLINQDERNMPEVSTVEAVPYDHNLPEAKDNDGTRKLLLLGSKNEYAKCGNMFQSDTVVTNDSDDGVDKGSGLVRTYSCGKEKIKRENVEYSSQMISPSALKRKRNSLGEDDEAGLHKSTTLFRKCKVVKSVRFK